MKRLASLLLVAVLAAGSLFAAKPNTGTSEASASAQSDSVSRAIAAVMCPLIEKNLNTLQSLGLQIDRRVFSQAVATYLEGGNIGFDARTGDAYIDDLVHQLHPEMRAAIDTVSMASQQAFLDSVASLDGAMRLPSGTIMLIVSEGEGAMPKDGDKVSVSYVGKLSDGTVFDDTKEDGAVDFDVDGVVPGFSDGLKHMKLGGTYRIVIPASAAYGAKGVPSVIPGNSALDFTVTLNSLASGEPKK